jgi:Flp pilus assembly protein TadD
VEVAPYSRLPRESLTSPSGSSYPFCCGRFVGGIRLASSDDPRKIRHTDLVEDVADWRNRSLWAALLLAATVLTVYGQVYGYGFVEFDDPGYVSENPYVRAGLTWNGVRWAFTTGHMWNWHPFTWLSHMLDVQMFGLHPGAHHSMNVVLHLANTLLLFALLNRTTHAPWPSLVVAAMFALHPLHVESVAWISERKDVLSTFFFFLTLWGYVRYVEQQSRRWYLSAIVFFACGLLTKQMLVTVPFVLLLLDVWPLGRLVLPGRISPATDGGKRRKQKSRRKERDGEAPADDPRRPMPWRALVWEKVPFFALTVVASIVAYLAQLWTGAMTNTASLPIALRMGNALIAYVRYLALTLWPSGLAVFYPYEMSFASWKVFAAALIIVVITLTTLRTARRHPYALIGWLWYLGMLVPVIGLVQVGSHAHADRFTYVPLVGIFVMLAWGGSDLIARWAVPKSIVAATVAGVIAAYSVATWMQVGVWRDGETLFTHAVRVTHANYLAHNNLGAALAAQGKTEAAIEQYREALRIKPDYVHARTNLAKAMRGRFEQAVAQNPGDPVARYDLGNALADAGLAGEAIEQYEAALRLKPDYADAHKSLGAVLAQVGSLEDAVRHYEASVRSNPNDPTARFNLGSTLARTGRLREAIEQYRQVVQLTPEDAEAWGNLAMAHGDLGETQEAVEAQRKAVELARAQSQWALARTMDDWLTSYRSSQCGETRSDVED